MIATIDLLKRRGLRTCARWCWWPAPEGVAALQKAHPDVRCWTAAIDNHLNELGYIIPAWATRATRSSAPSERVTPARPALMRGRPLRFQFC